MLVAHGYEMTTPEYTTIARGSADQNPSVLCQLKSRAFGRRPPRNHITLRNCVQLSARGHHRYMPLNTMNRNIRFAAPVIAFPVGRLSPLIARYRCQTTTLE